VGRLMEMSIAITILGGVQVVLLGTILKHLWGHPPNETIVTKESFGDYVEHSKEILTRIEEQNKKEHAEIKGKLDRLNGN
jgi:hypothetical protein